MSIEKKIAELLAESKAAGLVEEQTSEEIVEDVVEEITEEEVVSEATDINDPSKGGEENPDNKRNNVDKQEVGGKSKTANAATKGASAPEASNLKGVKEDVDALLNGEELSEDFRTKAETIFEAAVMTRVKSELARIEEEFEAKLAEQVAQNQEGLVEKVDGYLNYVVEQWFTQNEIALERGMKSEILESFVSGMKTLFEEHYIDVPEEKYDLLGEMEAKAESLEAKLDEQVAVNVALTKEINEQKRVTSIAEAAAGLSDTEVEKFEALAEELSFEDAETFNKKLQTIRENYFTTKASATEINSVVTDTPVETLTEEVKKVDPQMAAYLSILNRK